MFKVELDGEPIIIIVMMNLLLHITNSSYMIVEFSRMLAFGLSSFVFAQLPLLYLLYKLEPPKLGGLLLCVVEL